MDNFQTGLNYFFPENMVNYIVKARKEYQEALKFAYTAQKEGIQIEPEEMTKWELVQWYRKCLAYDPE